MHSAVVYVMYFAVVLVGTELVWEDMCLVFFW